MTATVGSLFSGIGGLDLGAERAGWRVIWQAETDPYASAVLDKHWPWVPNLGDVRKVRWDAIRTPDLVCGGFPCQPVSAAGRRMGTDDERWLWPQFARCLRVLRPPYALVENVPGVLSLGFGEIAAGLAALGYDLQWGSLPAAALGAPHLRWRVFVIATHSSADPVRVGTGRGDGQGRTHPTIAGANGDARDLADADELGRERRADDRSREGLGRTGDEPARSGGSGGGHWAAEPRLGRVADGVPDRLDRLRCLGNAVVPQVAEWVVRNWLPAP